MKLRQDSAELLNLASEKLNLLSVSNKDLLALAKENGFKPAAAYALLNDETRVSRGIFNLHAVISNLRMNPVEKENDSKSVASIVNDDKFIPTVDPKFVPWGQYSDILNIIKSGMFYPTYVFGLSGNGKTYMVEQACAKLNREFIRVQITPETDEDDLIGGFRLLNGDTVFAKGPVLKAMENGAVLLLDEIDRATNKIMCLQGILEGKSFLVKKTGQVIKPAPGFTVIATANTQGRGSMDGRFTAATIIDEAFLERFTVAIEQDYPSIGIEKKIVTNHMKEFGEVDSDIATKLVEWSSIIRKTYLEEGVEDLISTRRLCHIVQTNAIFKDINKSIKMCIARFEQETREAFMDLYEKLSYETQPQTEECQNEYITNDS